MIGPNFFGWKLKVMWINEWILIVCVEPTFDDAIPFQTTIHFSIC